MCERVDFVQCSMRVKVKRVEYHRCACVCVTTYYSNSLMYNGLAVVVSADDDTATVSLVSLRQQCSVLCYINYAVILSVKYRGRLL